VQRNRRSKSKSGAAVEALDDASDFDCDSAIDLDACDAQA